MTIVQCHRSHHASDNPPRFTSHLSTTLSNNDKAKKTYPNKTTINSITDEKKTPFQVFPETEKETSTPNVQLYAYRGLLSDET